MTHKNANSHERGPIDGITQGQVHLRAMQLPAFQACLQRSGMTEEGFVGTLLQTSLSRLEAWTLPDLERLLVAALKYNLTPVGREIFLCPGPLAGSPLLVVGVDGWSRILNEHEQFAGMRFKESTELVDGVPAWVECTIHRRDRRVPTSVREYLCEVRGSNSAWLTHPRRMLRHKAMIQCARVTFGLGEVVDPEEASQIFTARLGTLAETPMGYPRPQADSHSRRKPIGVKELRQALRVESTDCKTD